MQENSKPNLFVIPLLFSSNKTQTYKECFPVPLALVLYIIFLTLSLGGYKLGLISPIIFTHGSNREALVLNLMCRLMRHSYLHFTGKKKWDSTHFLGNMICSCGRGFLKYLFVSPLELMEFWGVPGTLLDTAYGLCMCLKIIQCVVAGGGRCLSLGLVLEEHCLG